MFQNLRANNQLYILHKDNKPRVEVVSVVSVSAPKPKYQIPSQIGQFQPMETVVDLTVSAGGQTTTFQNIPAGADIADFGQNGNIVISCSRDAMNNEVASMKQKSVDILNSVEYHKSVISGCDDMLSMLNPEFAAKQQQDFEISNLKAQMQEMSKNMTDLMAMNRQLAEQLGIGPEHAGKKK